jgi:hypothetical protein
MKKDWSHLDKYRQQLPPRTSPNGATYGLFSVKHNGVLLNIVASDADGEIEWEHVSVHVLDPVFRKQRIPNWLEMCFVKELFWDDDEVVVQFHPAKKDWISVHDAVLHLWRSKTQAFPTPPKVCV